jgi:hypothetical protein
MRCEGCAQTSGSQRRLCLMARAREAAAAGSEGGLLAARGEGAVGARVSVWWPLEEGWFKGVVSVGASGSVGLPCVVGVWGQLRAAWCVQIG